MKSHWLKLRPSVIQKIKPSAAWTKKAKDAQKRLEKKLLDNAKKFGITMKPDLVGSLAKDTHMLPEPDIDLFLLFPPETSREHLERDGIKLGKSVLQKPTLRYAEHPYVHGRFATFRFDVVPAYHVKKAEGKLSAVDRSPFHTRYVRAHLTATQRDEVRILKMFLKGIACYGAETATGGFSGYLAELLVLRFGSFWDVLMSMREMHPPIQLALDGEGTPLGGALVFIDPVDPSRNAAAAVNAERLDTFLRAAKMFTAAPKNEFFWPKKLKAESRERLIQHMSHRGIFGLDLPAPRVRPEARVPHLRRFAEKVNRRLAKEGLQVVRYVIEPVGTGYVLLWEHDPVVLPETLEHRGPPVDDPDNSRRFLQKWQAHPDAVTLPHPKDGHWEVTVRRAHRDPISLLSPHLGELIKGIEVPMPKTKKGSFRPGMEYVMRPGTRLALTKLLVPRDPWDV